MIIEQSITAISRIFQSAHKEEKLPLLIDDFNSVIIKTPLLNFDKGLENLLTEIGNDHKRYNLLLETIVKFSLLVNINELRKALTVELDKIKSSEFFSGLLVDLSTQESVFYFFLALFHPEILDRTFKVEGVADE